MIGMGSNDDENCPFQFNLDASTFKAGDLISYRVTEAFDDMPFVGQIVSVADDHIMLRHYGESNAQATVMKGTLEDRPVVSEACALGNS